MEEKTKAGMIKIALIVPMFLTLTLYAMGAQSQIGGEVQNAKGEPIAFVSVGMLNTTIGTVSDLHGKFSLDFSSAIDKDAILRFSCVGYQPKEIIISSKLRDTTLFIVLDEAEIILSEVTIRPAVTTEVVKGNDNESTSISTNLAISKNPNMNLGVEIGKKFRLGKQNHFVREVRVHLQGNNFDTAIFRLNFYQLVGGKPSNQINTYSIVRTVADRQKGWIAFDLSEEELVVTGTFVAAVEWIGASKKGSYLAMNLTMPALGQTHYYKYGAQNRWKVFRNMSTSMILVVDRG